MSDMFEIVPKHPECRNCKNIELELEENRFFGDGTLLDHNYMITCKHQHVCKEWMGKQHVPGDQL